MIVKTRSLTPIARWDMTPFVLSVATASSKKVKQPWVPRLLNDHDSALVVCPLPLTLAPA